jgi:3-mercaptopyruvate sulfurtransferase SseA
MMKALNVRKSQTVVVYETGKGWFATRAAFMLKTYGHPKVYILDGNFAKWTKEGRATEGVDEASFAADFDYNLNADNMISFERVK